MPDAITNTSPILYLYRIKAVDWLEVLFGTVRMPRDVAVELAEGRRRGHDVPQPEDYQWLQLVEPRSLPPEWMTADLGRGEVAAISLALEHPERAVLPDDALARRVALAAGLEVWGTLGVLLAAKSRGLTDRVSPLVDRLAHAGMWISEDVRKRFVALAGESS